MVFEWDDYATDKNNNKSVITRSRVLHGYGKLYDKHFNDIRFNLKNEIVEIGCRPGSAKLWCDYFSNAKIIGLDIEECNFTSPKFEYLKFNQFSAENHLSLITKYPNIDIIIDDGPHVPSGQITTLYTLLPKMKSDSWIVIEDIHVTDATDPYYLKNIENEDVAVNILVREWMSGVFKKYNRVPDPEVIKNLNLDIFIEMGNISEIIFIHKK